MSESPAATDLYSIGDASSITGLSPHTIRVWEKRYGRPAASRLPSGHRRYSRGAVNLLQAAAELIAYGLRPSQILTRSDEEVEALLNKERKKRTPHRSGLVEKSLSLNGKSLRILLEASMREIGVRATLHELVVPLVQRIGHAWAAEEIDIHQEHLLTEAIEDVLRSARLQIPLPKTSEYYVDVILVTMAGERHGLGLQILALLAAMEGISVHMLGVDLPVNEIIEVSRAYPEATVAVSISSAADVSLTTRQLVELRTLLDADTPLLAGGAGMLRRKPIDGVLAMTDLASFEEWVQKTASAEGVATKA
ncbi:MAG: MerR family transcriptional regulator [Planctomycetes bacterium]|nr:MerR family transcriptional regulator [Planctomycetota bacterium]